MNGEITWWNMRHGKDKASETKLQFSQTEFPDDQMKKGKSIRRKKNFLELELLGMMMIGASR